MKKIFATVLLMAIFIVSFTTKANSVDTDSNIEFVVSLESPELVAVATVDAVSIEGIAVINSAEIALATIVEGVNLPDIVSSESESIENKEIINVAEKSVSNLEGEINSVAVNTVSFDSDNDNSYADLPIDVGLCTTEFNLIEPLSSLIEYTNESICTKLNYDTEFINYIPSNVGKLTTFKI